MVIYPMHVCVTNNTQYDLSYHLVKDEDPNVTINISAKIIGGYTRSHSHLEPGGTWTLSIDESPYSMGGFSPRCFVEMSGNNDWLCKIIDRVDRRELALWLEARYVLSQRR